MSSKVPVIRQMAWMSLIPHLLMMGIVILLWYPFDKENYVLYGAMTYLIISQLSRRVLTRAHQKGMTKVKKGDFKTAIPDFEKSYDFFTKNEWIDEYRYWTLLSSSKIPYREMALNNIAFCHGQLGDGQQAKAFYERTLKEFPDSVIAKTGLNLLNSMEKK